MPYGTFEAPLADEMGPREAVVEEAVVLMTKMTAQVRAHLLEGPYWTIQKMAVDRYVHLYALGNYTLVASGDVHLIHAEVAS